MFAIKTWTAPDADPTSQKIPTASKSWDADALRRGLNTGAWKEQARATWQGSTRTHAALSWSKTLNDWSAGDFLLVPGALYNGNRYRCNPVPYSPRMALEDCRADVDTVISDVSRLNLDQTPATIELLAGDTAIPAICLWRKNAREGHIYCFKQSGLYGQGENGLRIQEKLSEGKLELEIQSPGLRRKRYRHMIREVEAIDAPHAMSPGQTMELEVELHRFPCKDIPSLYAKLFELQMAWADRAARPAELPFSEAFRLIEEKYERENWLPKHQLFATNPQSPKNPYQNGWCGGMHAVWSLLSSGKLESTAERARIAFNRIIEGQSGGGYFYGKYDPVNQCWASDGHNYDTAPHYRNFTLTRRQGDTLYYGIKAYQLLDARGMDVSRARQALIQNARALRKIWDTEGQFGQFIHQETGSIEIGGTACGAIVVAALALAADVFDTADCARVAREALTQYDQNFLQKGVCTGGIGDALQVPDSESTAALLEAAMALYALDADPSILAIAERAAQQAASWVMPYNYAFPEKSEFGRLGMRTVGTVFANVQNKHSAPGICTHSGLALLRLYEATGEVNYLYLLRDIARAIPQHVSREDRPIYANNGEALPSGWINERVNTSDWDDNHGGVFYGSCWCEISMLLTYAELPGIYVDRENALCVALDNLEVEWSQSPEAGELTIRNTTKFPATTHIWLRDGACTRIQILELPAQTTQTCSTLETTTTTNYGD